MFVIQPVRLRNELRVPSIFPRLVAADQQDCAPTWIERIEHSVGVARMLDTQLAHMAVFGILYAATKWESQFGALFYQQVHGGFYVVLLRFGQQVPPLSVFIRVFNDSTHNLFRLYSIKVILSTSDEVGFEGVSVSNGDL